MIFKGCILLCLLAFVSCQETTTSPYDSKNKTECLAQMVTWCEGMRYPQQGVGMSMLSVTYEDPNGYYRVFCSSDPDGTNCTRNGQPWFACVRVNDTNNNTLTYKGEVPSPEADDEICATADKAYNELFVQNMSYDNTTMQTELEKGMESFFAQLAAMQEQIEEIQKRLSGFPLFGGGNGFFPDHNILGWLDDDDNMTTLAPSNQIEKE